MEVGLVVVAAGGGTRLGLGDKAFVEVAGEPLVVHAVRCFLPLAEIGPIVVVAPPGQEAAMLRLIGGLDAPGRIAVCGGGATRRESVQLGLSALPPTRTVLVHDGARPLVTEAVIRRVLAGVAGAGAAIPGTVPKEAVREVSEGRISGTLDRNRLILAQTPQGFERALLEAAHARAAEAGAAADDDAELVLACGHPVAVVEGDERNLKITVPGDLAVAEQRLAAARAAVAERRVSA